ncbi:hypothetical protein ABB55_27725 [Prosthecomicrobium hirschii]|uniref:Uncharacterized protein n=2 Tax=Prosthecodimorpha hirschii TaxID=665126 RepID=A0A0P6WAG8_9HYPH|nr:hypothetical protein ABB55_27725 [Prosthecomicrobium hirschii]
MMLDLSALLPSVPQVAVVSRREFRGRAIRFVTDWREPADPPWVVQDDLMAAFGVALEDVIKRIALAALLRGVVTDERAVVGRLVMPVIADGWPVAVMPFWVGLPIARATGFGDAAWIRLAAAAWMDVHQDMVRRRAVPLEVV